MATVKEAASHSCHTICLHQGVLLPVGVSGPDEESGSHELQGSWDASQAEGPSEFPRHILGRLQLLVEEFNPGNVTTHWAQGTQTLEENWGGKKQHS